MYWELAEHAPAMDLDGDGRPELITWFRSGGAHCCSTAMIFRRSGTRVEATRLETLDAGRGIFVRLKGYSRPVMRTSDYSSAYLFSSFASTVHMPYAVEIGPHGFQLAARVMQADRAGIGPSGWPSF
ncbi:hypothetical protein [Flavisphingomonas formosensis]|uniref:hypothetical protein n=1 Tax=Flavisphingomonas formosensis TaxID=861534 RepID=UPI0012FC2345|nr:hypothetical protein [Sphingomonas formosensis]